MAPSRRDQKILQNLVDVITRSLRIAMTSCVGAARSPLYLFFFVTLC